MALKYTITLPLPLSLNRLYRTTRKGRFHKSAAYGRWVRQADMQWLMQKHPGRPRCIEGPFRARITLHPPDKRKRDSDNAPKVLFDFLQRIEVIRNDANCREHTVIWGEIRRTTSCCVVELEELPDIGLA